MMTKEQRLADWGTTSYLRHWWRVAAARLTAGRHINIPDCLSDDEPSVVVISMYAHVGDENMCVAAFTTTLEKYRYEHRARVHSLASFACNRVTVNTLEARHAKWEFIIDWD